MKMFRFVSLVFVFLIFCGFASNDDGLNVIKSDKGFIFVFNDSLESFLLEFRGKKFVDIEPEELIFSIDGQVIQFTIVPVKEFYVPNLEKDTLQQHFEFEVDYISKSFNSQLDKVEPKKFKTRLGRKAYYWELERKVPPSDTSNETVTKQIFASTNTNLFVVLISSPLTRKNNYAECKRRIFNALKNIQINYGKYNLDSLRYSLKRK
ncbi:MAG: hypothetical protein CH6_1993 [Candidatus Kapaibacterium sp.]|nr:MAG: hypothetical protein CH6_1993 [Candidatus Kapabacteria bacterium]